MSSERGERNTENRLFWSIHVELKWIINNNNNSWQAASNAQDVFFLFYGEIQRLKLKKVERQRQQSDERMRGNSDRTRRKSINRELMIFLLLILRNFVVSSEPERNDVEPV